MGRVHLCASWLEKGTPEGLLEGMMVWEGYICVLRGLKREPLRVY